jgi:hypothetical protein
MMRRLFEKLKQSFCSTQLHIIGERTYLNIIIIIMIKKNAKRRYSDFGIAVGAVHAELDVALEGDAARDVDLRAFLEGNRRSFRD